MSNVIVSPSILSADFANLQRDIENVEKAGADWIHVDVMDGHFVPNITIGVPVVKSLKKITKLPLDVHLMIDNPQKYIHAFAMAGASILTFHYEAVPYDEIIPLISEIKSYGIKAGISIKPGTHPEDILNFLPYIDLILIMTVEPGFGGQQFMPDCAKKITSFASCKNLIIQVDGGINAQTGDICKKYGANSLVAGNYIYNSENIEAAIASLRD